jgi:hypothetical protein
MLKRWFVYISVRILLYDVVTRCVVDVETVLCLLVFNKLICLFVCFR